MAYNPEKLESPNRSELKPQPKPKPATVRKLGATAIKGSKK